MTPRTEKLLIIGATVISVGPFLWFIVWMLYSAVTARDTEEHAKALSAPQPAAPEAGQAQRDFSGFKTFQSEDGVPMVQIPEGPFVMGAGADVDEDEMPAHEVYLDAYYIDLYEVTNARYQTFIKATGRRKQELAVFEDDTRLLLKADHPALGVSWNDAVAYCEWIGKRLPTEAEWEKAARGPVSWRWPWGDAFAPGHANIVGEEDGFKYTAPVGKHEAGRSFFGLYDMAGNVSEWVKDWYGDTYYKVSGASRNPAGPELGRWKVNRGGSWSDFSGNVRATKRFAAFSARADAVIGFRCAKSAKDVERGKL